MEFAILLPLLLLLLFGLVDFGRLFFVQIGLNSASIEGARASALGRTSASVTSIAQASAPQVPQMAGLAAGQITVTRTACPTPANGATTSVTTSMPFTWVTPVGLFAFASNRTVTSTSRMVCIG